MERSLYQTVLEEFAALYLSTTAALENPPTMLTAMDWKLVENSREYALYQIAILLNIPELMPPGKALTPLQRQQCLDFIHYQAIKQTACPCGRMTALDCWGQCGLESVPCQ